MQTSYPFENSTALGELEWSKFFKILGTGVVLNEGNNLLVYADSTGMRVKVKDGEARIMGPYYSSDAEETLAINTADSANPRIDRIILRLDWTANSILLAVLQGAPAVSPAAPALTQNTTRWEISLAQVRVNANVVTIAAGDVTDERTFAQGSIVSRSRNQFLGDTAHQAYGSADTRCTFPRVEVHRGSITMENNNASFRINEDGMYSITVAGEIQTGNTSHSYKPQIYKNGIPYKTVGNFPLSAIVNTPFIYAMSVELAAGDYIELWIHLNQTTADYQLPYTEFEITKVR